jgi:hypothetical protein
LAVKVFGVIQDIDKAADNFSKFTLKNINNKFFLKLFIVCLNAGNEKVELKNNFIFKKLFY